MVVHAVFCPLGFAHHRDAAPSVSTMHRGEVGRAAELEVHRVREGQGWGFLVPQAVPLSPASHGPRAQPVSPSPGTKWGFSSASSADLLGQAMGSVTPGGETFFKQCFSCAFAALAEAVQKPARLLLPAPAARP